MTWYDSFSSTPVVIAVGALGIAAVYIGSRPKEIQQIKKAVPINAQPVKPASKMAQTVR
jgi:hypothetical protein